MVKVDIVIDHGRGRAAAELVYNKDAKPHMTLQENARFLARQMNSKSR
jgi:hypothetical protein